MVKGIGNKWVKNKHSEDGLGNEAENNAIGGWWSKTWTSDNT